MNRFFFGKQTNELCSRCILHLHHIWLIFPPMSVKRKTIVRDSWDSSASTYSDLLDEVEAVFLHRLLSLQLQVDSGLRLGLHARLRLFFGDGRSLLERLRQRNSRGVFPRQVAHLTHQGRLGVYKGAELAHPLRKRQKRDKSKHRGWFYGHFYSVLYGGPEVQNTTANEKTRMQIRNHNNIINICVFDLRSCFLICVRVSWFAFVFPDLRSWFLICVRGSWFAVVFCTSGPP